VIRRSLAFLTTLLFVAGVRAADIPATFTQLGYLYYPEGVSNGGKVVVGNLYNDSPFIIGASHVGLPAVANGVSADGKTIVGRDAGSQPAGPKQTPDLYMGETKVVSASGKQMAGVANPYLSDGTPGTATPFVWTESRGFAWLPVLPGTNTEWVPAISSKLKIEGMSPDGGKIVGYNDGLPVMWELGDKGATVTALEIVGDPRQLISGEWGWIYKPDGMAALKQFLIESTDIDEALLAKYEFQSAELAADGTAITGYALKNGHPRGYLVAFDEAPFSMSPGGNPTPTPEPASLTIAVAAVLIGLGARRQWTRHCDVGSTSSVRGG